MGVKTKAIQELVGALGYKTSLAGGGEPSTLTLFGAGKEGEDLTVEVPAAFVWWALALHQAADT